MTIFLETKRLIIKTPAVSDLAELYTLQSDSEVMKYIGNGVRTESEVRIGLDKAIAHYKKHGFSLGSVYEKATGMVVGRAGLIYLAFNDSQSKIEVGYALYKRFWCLGYATELTQALIRWGFEHLPINEIFGVIKPQNESSRRVLEKSGMSYVGRSEYNGLEIALYQLKKDVIDYSQIQFIPATLPDYPVMQNMGRFYVYDMSDYMGNEEGWEIPEDGLYECRDFKEYFTTPDNFPFLIRHKNELLGFVVINKKGGDVQVDYNMAQFFILKKFQKKAVGRFIAEQCFKKFPGIWEIMILPGNEGAYRFWRSVVRHFTQDNFLEYSRKVAHFNNTQRNMFRLIVPAQT